MHSTGGMFTANTMSSAVEALGMSPPHTASGPAVTTDNQLTNQKRADCGTVAELIFHLLEQKTQTRHIMTREVRNTTVKAKSGHMRALYPSFLLC